MIKKIIKPIILKYENRELNLPTEIKEKVKIFWEEQIKENPNLFNGENHCVESIVENENYTEMYVVRTNYASHLYNERIGISDEKYNIIHIWSGILLETLDNFLAIGEMDSKTSVPKCLQIPGGGTSDEDIIDNILDININLKRELKEELNLDLDKIKYEIKYLECPSVNRNVYGFLAVGRLNMTKNELKQHFSDYKKYLEDNNLEQEFSRIIFIHKNTAVQELDNLENPKRPYLRDLLEIIQEDTVNRT